MTKAVQVVYALVDWHNVQSEVARDFHRDPRRKLPEAIAMLQDQLARLLMRVAGRPQRFRATLRIYHGWHHGRSSTPIRRDFEQFSQDPNLARRIGNVSFPKGFQFGNELYCFQSPVLFSTFRGSGVAGQKMVDTAIVCDLLHMLRFDLADIVVILSDDDDYIPAMLTARSWGKRAVLLRGQHSDISHVTDLDCSANLWYWSRA